MPLMRSVRDAGCVPRSNPAPSALHTTARRPLDRRDALLGLNHAPTRHKCPPPYPPPPNTTRPRVSDGCQFDPAGGPRSLPRAKGNLAALRNAARADIVKLQGKHAGGSRSEDARHKYSCKSLPVGCASIDYSITTCQLVLKLNLIQCHYKMVTRAARS